MKQYIPSHIIDNYSSNVKKGKFNAYTLFMDISGFTAMTSALMKHGKKGAEQLSIILKNIFGKAVDSIYSNGGFVTTFAGDAATIIFQDNTPQNALAAASDIQDLFDRSHLQRTDFGEFTLDVKIGLDHGSIEWGIIEAESLNRSAYFYRGGAIDGAAYAEHYATVRQIVAANSLSIEGFPFSSTPIGEKYQLLKPEKNKTHRSKPEVIQSEIKNVELLKKFIPVEEIPKESAGEFRNISSLFISFSDIDKSLDSIITSILAHCSDYDGYFNMLDFGDKGGLILILFGAPHSHENDLTRAVSCARSITEELGSSVRCGISYGTAYTGVVGGKIRQTYTALGSVVNLAARIVMLAEWGSVEVSSSVEKETLTSFSYKHAATRKMKGFSSEQNIYRLTGILDSETDNVAAVDFIGREYELNLIIQWANNTGDDKSSVHYIYGPAGIGKTYLAEKTEKILSDDFIIIRLFADTIIRKSMNPFVTALRHYLKIPNNVTEEEVYNSLYKHNSLYKTSDDSQKEFLEQIHRSRFAFAELLGIKVENEEWNRLDAQAKFEVTASTIAAHFIVMSFKKPLMIFVEDAQALDADSKVLFTRLVKSASDFPIKLFVFSREGDGEGLPIITSEKIENETAHFLRPFNDDESTILVTRIMGVPPSKSLHQFLENRTNNNPLFLHELLLHLRRTQLIVNNGREAVLVREDQEIPDTLNSIMVSRIDSLKDEIKRYVQYAAVIGQEFPGVVLKKVAELNKTEDLLELTISHNILFNQSDEVVSFRLPLMQQAAYAMLFDTSLKKIHAQTAESIIQIFGDTPQYYADVAYHYENAGIDEKAKETLRKAVDYTKRTFKNEKSIEFIKRYLKYTDEESDFVEMYSALSDIYELTGRWNEALAYIRYAIGSASLANDAKTIAKLFVRAGTIYQYQNKTEKSKKALEFGIETAGKFNDAATLSEGYVRLGRTLWITADFKAASDVLETGIEYSIASKRKDMEGLGYYYKGTIFRDTNHFDDAISMYIRSRDVFVDYGNDRLTTYPLYDLGVVSQYQGKLDEAERYMQSVAEVYDRIGYQSGTSAALLNLGTIEDRKGNFEQALEYYKQSKELAESLGEDLAIAYAIFSIGATHYKNNDYRKAVEYLKDSYKIMKNLNAQGYYGYVFAYLTSLFAAEGNVENTIRSAYLHVKNIEKTGTDVENGRTYLALGILFENKDAEQIALQKESTKNRLIEVQKIAGVKNNSPEEYYHKAIEVASSTSYMNTLIPAEFHFGKFLKDNGDQDAAQIHLARALRLARESGWQLMAQTIESIL
jgi:class 3 adenylate cyclase/predicted ATPase